MHKLIIIIILCIHVGVELEFTVSPTSQVVPTGLQQTIFYCIHTTAESIGWRVNDAPLAHQIYTGISACINRRRDGVIINRLKVDIEQAYDGLKIECAALFSDRPPIISEPANLTIEGTGMLCIHVLIANIYTITFIRQYVHNYYVYLFSIYTQKT